MSRLAKDGSSSLSSHSDDEFAEDFNMLENDNENDNDTEIDESALNLDQSMPPAKRRRLAHPARSSSRSPIPAHVSNLNASPSVQGDEDISSDTSGSVPGSPRALNVQIGPDDDTLGQEQIRTCFWEGCSAGELDNQDDLVRHVHDDHIGAAKRTKYTCEWGDCKAKGKTQMSAYALRAHMRSHTKEKPFYCALPECDRSFTRSDALAKHMRTVHESESVKTAEHYLNAPHPIGGKRGLGLNGDKASPTEASPAPPNARAAGETGSSKPPKSLKLVFGGSKVANTNNNNSSSPKAAIDLPQTPQSPLSPSSRDAVLGVLPEELHFTSAEKQMPRDQLFRLLRRRIAWAEEDSAALAREIEEGEARKKKEWIAKELALENVLEAEAARAERKVILFDDPFAKQRGATNAQEDGVSDAEDADMSAKETGDQSNPFIDSIREASEYGAKLPLPGSKLPWYRDKALRDHEMSLAKRVHEERVRKEQMEAAAEVEEAQGSATAPPAEQLVPTTSPQRGKQRAIGSKRGTKGTPSSDRRRATGGKSSGKMTGSRDNSDARKLRRQQQHAEDTPNDRSDGPGEKGEEGEKMANATMDEEMQDD